MAPDAPNPAGAKSACLERRLEAFRRGERQRHSMTLIARALDPEQIKDIAAWHGRMVPTVEIPPPE